MQESLLAISDLVVQFLFRYGKTERARSLTESQGASRAETGSKSKTETTTTPACEENSHNHTPRGESLESHRHARLSIKSEYVVTQPAEVRILGEMSEAGVREFAKSHGWGVIRRLGGRQIEFYTDASRLPL